MKIRRIIFLLLFCLYIAAVACLCFARPDTIPTLPESWFGLPADKVAHYLMFLPFTILGFLTFEGTDRCVWKTAILLLALTGLGFAAAVGTEFAQAYLGYRSKDTLDLIADSMGLLSGGILTVIYIFVKNRK
jgi:VanZ family protein